MSNLYKDIATYGLDAAKPTAQLTLAAELPNTFQFYYATDTDILYRWNGTAWTADTSPNPIGVGATKTAARTNGGIYALDTAAGSVLTLPAALGSGLVLDAYVSVSATSNAHKILASPVTDVLIGRATGSVAAGTTLQFSALVSTGAHSIQMPFSGTQPSGGIQGDVFHFRDVAAGVWLVEATYESGTTSTTPFSTSTT